MHDLKYALRMLVKSPGFSLVAILSLALGIGANTAIFSLINAVLLRPLPVADPQSLVIVSTTDQRNPGNLPLSHLNFKDLRAQNAVFTDMASICRSTRSTTATAQESEQIPVQIVTANFFSLLGAEPALGRGFRADEEAQAMPVAVVSHGFWERSLGSNPGVGRQDGDTEPDAVHDRRRRAEELHRRASRRRTVGLAADVAQRRRPARSGTRPGAACSCSASRA